MPFGQIPSEFTCIANGLLAFSSYAGRVLFIVFHQIGWFLGVGLFSKNFQRSSLLGFRATV